MQRFKTGLRAMAVCGLFAPFTVAAQPGQLDPLFATGIGADALVRRVLPLADGKVLIAGNFTQYDGHACGRIARLNPDGSFDGTYNSGSGFDGFVLDMELTSTGGVVACGDFLSYDGAGLSGHVIRLNPDGTRDAGFSPPIFGASAINALEVTPTDGIILTGALSVSAPVVQSRVVKLMSTGTVDASFTTGATPLAGAFLDVERFSDDRLCVIGSFTSIQGVARNGICVLQANGALDLSFDPGPGANSLIQDVAIDQDDLPIIAGTFTSYNGESVGRIARLSLDGARDPSFDAGTGFDGSVQHVLPLADGAMLCAGLFTSVDGTSANRFCKLLGDGSMAPGFLLGAGANDAVAFAALRPDASILIGGLFTSYQGTARGRLARLEDCLPAMWFADTDGDGFGNAATSQFTCPQPSGFVANSDDCDDSDDAIGPGSTWYRDLDGDENGDHADSMVSCDQPSGYVENPWDCDDSDPGIAMDNACDDGDPYTTSDVMLPWPDCGCAGVSTMVSAKVMLEGAYDPGTGLMRDDLRALGLLPLNEPFTALGYAAAPGSPPSEPTTPGVFAVTGPDAIVDWVVLEFRAQHDGAVRLATRYALLQRDGDIADLDGVSPVRFPLSFGHRRLAVLHRNHMGVVTANSIYFEETAVDFADPLLDVHNGVEARRNESGTMLLRMGDSSFNDQIMYMGEGNDRDLILTRIGGSVPTNVVNGYYNEDNNLDGVVRYVGEGNDRDPILVTVGGAVPTNVRSNSYLYTSP